MFADYLGAALNLTQLAAGESVYRLIVVDDGDNAVDLSTLTFSGACTSCADDTVSVIGAAASESETNSLTIFFPALPSGNYRWELMATDEAGQSSRVVYGQLLVMPTGLSLAADDNGDDGNMRTLYVRLPGSLGRPLHLRWLSSTIAEAAANDAVEAAGRAEEAADKAASAVDEAAGKVKEAIEEQVGGIVDEVNDALDRVNDALDDVDRLGGLVDDIEGELKDTITFNPDTGTIWIGDYNTGAVYRGEAGRSPVLSDTLTWVVYSDEGGMWVDTGVRAVGRDTKSPEISTSGTWLLWDMDTETYTDTGQQAVGRDGIDGQAVRRIVVDRVDDIPQSGETCTGGYYYYVPRAAEEWEWARLSVPALPDPAGGAGGEDAGGDAAEEEPLEAWLIINGAESISIGAGGDLDAAAAAVQDGSKYVSARVEENENHSRRYLLLTAIEPGTPGNTIGVQWALSEQASVTFPAGTDNGNFNYMELPAGYIGRGKWKQISMLCRSSSSGSFPVGGKYLGVWELNEARSEWVKIGVSTTAESQSVRNVVVWEFENLMLSGRALRLTLLDEYDDEWMSSHWFCARVSVAEKGEKLYYNGSDHAFVPQMEWVSAEAVDLGTLSGGVDAKAACYDVYAWLLQGSTWGWAHVGDVNDLATVSVTGLVKLGTSVIVGEGAVVGLNANGQMVVPRATLGDYGAVKAGSYITQVNDRPYQQAVGLTSEGNLANNILYGGALKHMTVTNWAGKGMDWLTAAMEADPGKYREGDYNTGLETSAQFTQGSGTLELLEATTARLAGVYLATGAADGRAAAVITPTVMLNHLAQSYYDRWAIDGKLTFYVKISDLENEYYSKEAVDAMLAEQKADYESQLAALRSELKQWVQAQDYDTVANVKKKLGSYVKTTETVTEIQALTTEEFNGLETRNNTTLYLN